MISLVMDRKYGSVTPVKAVCMLSSRMATRPSEKGCPGSSVAMPVRMVRTRVSSMSTRPDTRDRTLEERGLSWK